MVRHCPGGDGTDAGTGRFPKGYHTLRGTCSVRLARARQRCSGRQPDERNGLPLPCIPSLDGMQGSGGAGSHQVMVLQAACRSRVPACQFLEGGKVADVEGPVAGR